MKKALRIIGINLAVCVVLVLALEVGLRAGELYGLLPKIHPDVKNGITWLEYDSTNDIWRNRKSKSDFPFTIDAAGNRDVVAGKKDGALRVACVGDSGTFGVWKEGDNLRFDSFVDHLAALTQLHVENFGTVGHTTHEGIIRMREMSPDVDVVIARFGWNDHARASTVHRPASAILRHVSTARLVESTGPHVSETELRANVLEMARIAHDRGQRLIWADYPVHLANENISLPIHMRRGYVRDLAELDKLHARYQKIIEDACRDAGIEFVRTGLDADCFSPDDAMHPNALGCERIAGVLAGVIGNNVDAESHNGEITPLPGTNDQALFQRSDPRR
ncbi:MAG: SGNH/GDSL hydrolase family protein [Candidatus Hydrogenedentes bacterium]|nr:SGNH/GDSL hydrolase family protein [Candidatus Hydrogenedentota bacterium]